MDAYQNMRNIYSEDMENHTPEGPGLPIIEESGFVAALVSLVAQRKVSIFPNLTLFNLHLMCFGKVLLRI